MYAMDLDCGCIQFSAVGKLLSNKYVRDAIAAKTGKLIRKFPGKQWDQIAQLMLDACVDKEGTDDLEFKGAARIHLSKYLSDNPPASATDRLRSADRYGPLIDDDVIAVSSTDLQGYIARTSMQNLPVKLVAAMLSSLGAKSVRIRKGSHNEQSRWALPANEWNPRDYATGSRESTDGE